MKKKLLAATLMAAMTITTVFGGSAVLAADDAASTKVITDSMGNEVEVPTEIKSMAILPMPWISVVYALNGSGDIITGMQQVAKNSYETSMLKKLAPELEDTNTTFFEDGEFNYEELAKINPDVVMLFESQSKHIDKLKEVGIPCGNHRARQMMRRDYEEFDYIIGMDAWNILNIMRIIGSDPEKKVSMLLDYTDRPGTEIADPWYTGNFDATYDDVLEGCTGLLEHLKNTEAFLNL